MELCKVGCGDAVRPCLRGFLYENMQLASGSNEVGHEVQEVVLSTKNYKVDHTSWILCPGYPRLRVRGVQAGVRSLR